MASVYLRYSLRNFSQRKGRTALTLLGVTIGVAAIVTLVALADGLQTRVLETFAEVQRIQVTPKGSEFAISILREDNLTRIQAVEGVLVASPTIDKVLSSIEGRPLEFDLLTGPPFLLTGLDPNQERLSPGSPILRNLRAGRFLIPGDRSSAVIGKDVAEAFLKKVGDRLQVENVELRIVGLFDADSPFIDNRVVVPMEVARELAGLGPGEMTGIWVDVRDPEEGERVARRITLKVPEVRAQSPESSAAQFTELLGTVRSGAFAITGVAAVVGGVGIANSMLMNVLERRREIGVLKAVGWSNSEVMQAILLEAVLIGLLGGVAGTVLGGAALVGLTASQPTLAYDLSIGLVAQVFAFALLLGLLGGLYPAWSTTRIQPAEALRYE